MREALVIDANISVRLFVDLEHSAFIQDYLQNRAQFAPALIISETASALLKYVRTGDVPRESAMAAINALPSMIDQRPSGSFGARAMGLAIDLEHSVYDCFYAVCAETMRLPLLTADRKFAAKLSARKPEIETLDLFELVGAEP